MIPLKNILANLAVSLRPMRMIAACGESRSQ